MRTSKLERAVLAGGCFWGIQDLIRKLPARWTRDCRARDRGRRALCSWRTRSRGLPGIVQRAIDSPESLRYVQSVIDRARGTTRCLAQYSDAGADHLWTPRCRCATRQRGISPRTAAPQRTSRRRRRPLHLWEDADDEYAALVTAWWAGGFKAWMKTSTAAAAVPGDASTQ